MAEIGILLCWPSKFGPSICLRCYTNNKHPFTRKTATGFASTLAHISIFQNRRRTKQLKTMNECENKKPSISIFPTLHICPTWDKQKHQFHPVSGLLLYRIPHMGEFTWHIVLGRVEQMVEPIGGNHSQLALAHLWATLDGVGTTPSLSAFDDTPNVVGAISVE